MDIDKFYQLMGTAIKRIYGYYMKRPLQRFNVDNRAQKLLDKQQDVPRIAPKHKGTKQLFKQITVEHPEIKKQLEERSEDLLSRLKSVKVVSKDVPMTEEELRDMAEMRQKIQNRLPQSRTGELLPMHAYIEPQFVPKGRVSLFSALKFLAKHKMSPKEYTPQMIATDYHMKVEDVNNIVMYFKPFYKHGKEDKVVEDPKELVGMFSMDAIKAILKPLKEQKSVIEDKPQKIDSSKP